MSPQFECASLSLSRSRAGLLAPFCICITSWVDSSRARKSGLQPALSPVTRLQIGVFVALSCICSFPCLSLSTQAQSGRSLPSRRSLCSLLVVSQPCSSSVVSTSCYHHARSVVFLIHAYIFILAIAATPHLCSRGSDADAVHAPSVNACEAWNHFPTAYIDAF